MSAESSAGDKDKKDILKNKCAFERYLVETKG